MKNNLNHKIIIRRTLNSDLKIKLIILPHLDVLNSSILKPAFFPVYIRVIKLLVTHEEI